MYPCNAIAPNRFSSEETSKSAIIDQNWRAVNVIPPPDAGVVPGVPFRSRRLQDRVANGGGASEYGGGEAVELHKFSDALAVWAPRISTIT
jgi:hypothetical protein